MKRRFVLDENTVICAQRGSDPYGRRDPSFADLLFSIERNCHALVMLRTFFSIYSSQLNKQFGRIPHDPKIMAIIATLLRNLNKDHHFVQDEELEVIEGLEDIAHVDRGDRAFVLAAASSPGSILVTDDAPLTIALHKHDIPRRYRFTVLTARAALPLAGPAE